MWLCCDQLLIYIDSADFFFFGSYGSRFSQYKLSPFIPPLRLNLSISKLTTIPVTFIHFIASLSQ